MFFYWNKGKYGLISSVFRPVAFGYKDLGGDASANRIHNIRQYTLTSLFRAPTTMRQYYHAKAGYPQQPIMRRCLAKATSSSTAFPIRSPRTSLICGMNWGCAAVSMIADIVTPRSCWR